MIKSAKKGGSLEYAAAQIHEVLLRRDPALQGRQAKIVSNRWFNIGGIRFEVDVLVTVAARREEYVHVIECKDWKQPVGVPEISHLDMKRRLLKAESASIVARTFTEPAIKLAALCGIQVVTQSEKFVPLEVGAPVSTSAVEGGTAEIQFYGPDTAPQPQFDGSTTWCLLRGRSILLYDLSSSLVEAAIKRAEASDRRQELPGIHLGHAQFSKTFASGELLIVGKSVFSVSSRFTYSTQIVFPTVVTKFGIERRGGLIRLYPCSRVPR